MDGQGEAGQKLHAPRFLPSVIELRRGFCRRWHPESIRVLAPALTKLKPSYAVDERCRPLLVESGRVSLGTKEVGNLWVSLGSGVEPIQSKRQALTRKLLEDFGTTVEYTRLRTMLTPLQGRSIPHLARPIRWPLIVSRP